MNKSFLDKHGFCFNKKFGQNFISDKNLLNAIVKDAGVCKNDVVVEIGAGAGALTFALSENCKKLISFEIDKNLKPVLEEVLTGKDNVELVFSDIMKIPMGEIDQKAGKGFKVVANLPYYITTPILMNFVEKSGNVSTLTIMVQKEVAERLAAKSGCKDYGSVTVAVKSVADVKITRIVNRNMFFPVPNVDSAVIRIDFKRDKYKINNKECFKKTVNAAFGARRKQLQNNLSKTFGFDKEKATEILFKLGVDKNIRGEMLTIEQFVELSNLVFNEKNN